MADWQLVGNDGTVYHVPTGTQVPIGGASPLAVEYQAFLDGAGTPDPAEDYVALATRKAALKAKIDAEARELAAEFSAAPQGALHYLERLREARLADVDGTPTAAEYPLLDAEVGHTGVDIAAVATAVLAEWATVQRDLGTLEALRLDHHDDVDAAADTGALTTLERNLAWPPFYPRLRRTTVDLEPVDFANVDVPTRPELEAGLFEFVPIDPALVFA